ncbi:hypothetical protein E5D92_04860 [Helicobacter pylori]|nr:hypothetical protein FNE56_05090 [Helicobacter pylori]WQT69060.1 hypothetical protein E5D92_04860 [Helicobacter pylori]
MTPSHILNICFDLNEKTLQIDFSQTDTETQNKILEDLFGKEIFHELFGLALVQRKEKTKVRMQKITRHVSTEELIEYLKYQKERNEKDND